MSGDTTVADVVFMRAVVIGAGVGTVWDTQTLTLDDLEALYAEVLREAAAEEGEWK